MFPSPPSNNQERQTLGRSDDVILKRLGPALNWPSNDPLTESRWNLEIIFHFVLLENLTPNNLDKNISKFDGIQTASV